MTKELFTKIAMICHEANRAWCIANGDDSQKPWSKAPKWQKESAVNGVKHKFDNPDSTPEDSHKSWMKEKEETGWKYGKVKDPAKKEHPCMVPYNELPEVQKIKDTIFQNIVSSFLPQVADENEVVQGDSPELFSASKNTDQNIKADKTLRKGIDVQLQKLKSLLPSRERALAITKLQESIMWLGMDLKRLGGPNPYPNSYNPENNIVEPTADNLKL